MTRYDTLFVTAKDSVKAFYVKQKAPAMALKIPHNTIGLSVGYVQKNWDYSFPEDTAVPPDIYKIQKIMPGVQAGIRLDLYFASTVFGLGISTGLYYQYTKIGTLTEPNYQNKGGQDKRTMKEQSIYFPVHLIYRYDFSKTVGLFIHGGFAIDYCFSLDPTAQNIKTNIGDNHLSDEYEKTIVSGEFGGGIRLGRFIFSITTSTHGEEITSIFTKSPVKFPNCRTRAVLSLMLG